MDVTTFTMHTHLNFITQGSATNVKYNFVSRLVLYADGNVEFVTDHATITCQ